MCVCVCTNQFRPGVMHVERAQVAKQVVQLGGRDYVCLFLELLETHLQQLVSVGVLEGLRRHVLASQPLLHVRRCRKDGQRPILK